MKQWVYKNWMGPAFLLVPFMYGMLLSGCTENTRVKAWGGTGRMDLKPNEKLVTMTWKEANLWTLIRPMRADEKAECYSFTESSNWGMVEGAFEICEHKK